MLESQVFSCPILHLMPNQAFLAAESYHVPFGIRRCEQGMVLRLPLVLCRWCYRTCGVVQAPEILVNSCTVPTRSHLGPLRFLFFLGILTYKCCLVEDVQTSLSGEMLPHHTPHSPAPFLNPSLPF